MLQTFQDLFCPFNMLFVVQKESGLLLMAHEDILVHRQVREQAQFLMDNADALGSCSVGVLEIDLLASHVHLSCRGLLNAGDHLHKRGFPGAVLSDQNVYLCSEKIEGNAVKGFGSGINFIYFFAMENNIRIVIHHVSSLITLLLTKPA